MGMDTVIDLKVRLVLTLFDPESYFGLNSYRFEAE